jgi:toxin FitB
MIILDTNVLSALMRDVPDQNVVKWLNEQPRLSIWITSITVLEIRFGIAIMTTGRQRSRLNDAFERTVNDKLDRRVATFDEVSARASTTVMANSSTTRPDGRIARCDDCRHRAGPSRDARHGQQPPFQRFINSSD